MNKICDANAGASAALGAGAALAALASGELSAEALAQVCLARIDLRDPQVHAWSCVDRGQVLAQARAIDLQQQPPHDLSQIAQPLRGLPVGIKDVILTADLPTQYNSPHHAGFHPRVDASCVRLLRGAGALILGKTDTVEFGATGRKALTCNPHDLARTPGGSSSGSAAAVADGHVSLALGTQTGGSMMRPASYCGVWAIKPTWGLVSNEGCMAYAPSLDTLGWFARSARDLGLLHAVFDPDGETAAPQPDLRGSLAGTRLACCRTPMWQHAEPATQQAMDTAVRQLRALGASVTELVLPEAFNALPALQRLIMHAEGRAALLCEYREHPHTLEACLRDQVLNASGITRAQLCAAYDQAAAGRALWDHLSAGFDAVLVPSAVGEAPLGLAATGDMIFNGLWTLLHAPCINVPGWRGPNGLPLGLTLTGPRFSDRQLLKLASAFQDELMMGAA